MVHETNLLLLATNYDNIADWESELTINSHFEIFRFFIFTVNAS